MNKSKSIDTGRACYDFESTNEAIELARPRADLADTTAFSRSQSASHFGTSSYAEAETLAVEGWPAGMEQANKLRAGLVGVLGSYRQAPKLARSVAGFAPCVPAAIAGDCNSMFAFQLVKTPQQGKIVHVVANICASYGISGHALQLRGAIALALVDTLENCGFRCQVTVCTGLQKEGDQSHDMFVPLKASEDGLNIDTLSFWLANPASFRRLFWGLWSNEHAKGEFNPHGMPSEVSKDRRGDIYLSMAHLDQVNDQTAAPFLKETLIAYGVEFDS